MSVKIALAGNPNCGKTTMFNDLTGSNQRVGNWPGVTVEKKEGRLKGRPDVIIQDLPGIYSLSPYTLEEVVARSYLVGEKPDAIINIVDGTNIERNLYLTTQLIELGIPTVVAVNMMDVVRKNGDVIDLRRLGAALGCEVVATSALKGEGSREAAERAAEIAAEGREFSAPSVFEGSVEHAIAHIEESIEGRVEPRFLRWYAIKLFERDEKVAEELKLEPGLAAHIEQHIADCEKELDDDSESIITNQRYAYIAKVVGSAVKKALGAEAERLRQDRPHRDEPRAGPAHLRRHYGPGVLHLHRQRGRLDGRLHERHALRRVDNRRADHALCGLERRALALRPGHRRHSRRRRRGAGLCAADAHPLPAALDTRGRGLHGARGVHHGPHLPQVRALGQELHPDAHRLRLRRARRHGQPHH